MVVVLLFGRRRLAPAPAHQQRVGRGRLKGDILLFIKSRMSPFSRLIPGVGEAIDFAVLASPDSSALDRLAASASLGVNYLTGGFAPNYGALIKFAKPVKAGVVAARGPVADWAQSGVRAANPSKGPLWTSTSTKSGVENALGHFKKHGAEFPEYANATQYARGARDFVTNPPAGTLSKVRANGDTLFYNPTTNTFAVQRGDGALRTMFRPTDGISYWNKQ